MPDTGIATAADYSEALGVARRAKSTVALLLLLMLVAQVATFLLIRYDILHIDTSADQVTVNVTTPPATALPPPTTTFSVNRLGEIMHDVTGLTLLGGIALALVLAAVLILIDHIMLVGRLIGVGKVTSALVWAFILIVFLFPWQAFLQQTGLDIPGVLWTWDEMIPRVHFVSSMTADTWAGTVLAWFRFVAAPAIAVILILVIQLKSNRGLRMAMGEDEMLNEMMRGS